MFKGIFNQLSGASPEWDAVHDIDSGRVDGDGQCTHTACFFVLLLGTGCVQLRMYIVYTKHG